VHSANPTKTSGGASAPSGTLAIAARMSPSKTFAKEMRTSARTVAGANLTPAVGGVNARLASQANSAKTKISATITKTLA
jgi:hypothetical protein